MKNIPKIIRLGSYQIDTGDLFFKTKIYISENTIVEVTLSSEDISHEIELILNKAVEKFKEDQKNTNIL